MQMLTGRRDARLADRALLLGRDHEAPLATKSLTHCGEVANEAQRLVWAGVVGGRGRLKFDLLRGRA